MSACDTCVRPGSCCSGFVLIAEWARVPDDRKWAYRWRQILRRIDLPFRITGKSVIRQYGEYPMPVCDCPWLGTDGRCKNYERRPTLCRTYQPLQDALCTETLRQFKGIPVVMEAA